MSIKSKLSQLDKGWDDVRDEFGDSTGGFSTIPSGNYVFHKVKASLDESKSGGLLVKRSAVVKEGDLEGETCYDNMNLETERGPEFLLKWLNLMGYQVDSLKKDLEDALQKISDNEEATFQVTVKEADGYNNVYYNKCIDEGDPDGGGTSTESGKTDDAGDAGDMPELDELSKRKLKKLIKENSLDVDEGEYEDDDELRDAIEEAWKKKGSSSKSDKSEKTATRTASRKSGDKSDKKILKGLYDLCDAFGIKYEEDADLKEMKKSLNGYSFKPKDLDKSEKQALEDAGLEKIIK